MSDEMKVLSEHPVSDAMRATVLRTLRGIERDENVHVLFACESGSRGWGFASPDSDYDVRFVYVRGLSSYLTVNPRRDVIERPIDRELDLGGWDLRKALQLMLSSNPALLEWLRSPVVYLQDVDVATRLHALAEENFSLVRGYHHYVSMAMKNLSEHLGGETVRLKKYLYVLRPLMAARWIREHGSVPPMVFARLVEGTRLDAEVLAELNALLAAKMRTGESGTCPRFARLHDFIERELAQARTHVVTEARKAHDRAPDALLRDVVLQFGASR